MTDNDESAKNRDFIQVNNAIKKNPKKQKKQALNRTEQFE